MKISFTLTLFLLVLLTSCKKRLENPLSFFGNSELKEGKYKLIGVAMEGQHIEGFGSFYIDDLTTLQKMSEQWKFEYKSEPMACGFGYELSFLKDTVVLNHGLLNLECGYLNTDQQNWLYFPSNYLTDHVSKFKKLPTLPSQENQPLSTN